MARIVHLSINRYLDDVPLGTTSYREGKAQTVEGGIKVEGIHIRANKVILQKRML